MLRPPFILASWTSSNRFYIRCSSGVEAKRWLVRHLSHYLALTLAPDWKIYVDPGSGLLRSTCPGIATAHIVHGCSLREIAAQLDCSGTTVHRRVHACGDGVRFVGTGRGWYEEDLTLCFPPRY